MSKDIEIQGYSTEEKALADDLISQHYDELMKIARARRRRSVKSDTLGTVDVLHDSFMKLDRTRTWSSREHFINAAALAIRHVIIDHARRKKALKRGEGISPITYDGDSVLLPEFWETSEQMIQISHLMEKLQLENPRWMRIVDARYFCGFTEAETARILNMSERTVRREWQYARAWMANKMGVEKAI